jgi:hypothetical protein
MYRPGPYMIGSLEKKGWERQYKSDDKPCPDRIQHRCYSVNVLADSMPPLPSGEPPRRNGP